MQQQSDGMYRHATSKHFKHDLKITKEITLQHSTGTACSSKKDLTYDPGLLFFKVDYPGSVDRLSTGSIYGSP